MDLENNRQRILAVPIPDKNVGLLGADYTIKNGRFRFTHVDGGENWNPELQAPLTHPGVNVVAREYRPLLHIDHAFFVRQLAWIERNQWEVNQLSGGKLAYVHLPDAAGGGFTCFNRYFFAQIGKQGAVSVALDLLKNRPAYPDYHRSLTETK